MKGAISILVIVALSISLYACTPYHTQGAGAGAAVGGISGALLDSRNPWRGGLIGAVLGGVIGATMADISYRASQEAAARNRPVVYYTDDRSAVYHADPMEYDEQTRCRKVRERVWENDRLVQDRIKEVCEGQRTEERY